MAKGGVALTKQEILKAKRWHDRRDLLSVLLEDGKSYTAAAVDAAIEKFMKGRVK